MSGRPWTNTELETLRARYPHEVTGDIARDLGRSRKSVHQKAWRLGLGKPPQFYSAHGFQPGNRYGALGAAANGAENWCPRDVERLRALYPNRSTAAVARDLGMTVKRVRAKAQKLRLRKAPAYLRGKSAAEWPADAPAPRHSTTVPIGAERVTAEGYRLRKVGDTGNRRTDWRHVHVLLWEKHHGPVPPGRVVAFRDGNRGNVTLANLVLRTKGEIFAINSIHNLPPEIAATYRAVGVLRRTVRRKEEHLAKQG